MRGGGARGVRGARGRPALRAPGGSARVAAREDRERRARLPAAGAPDRRADMSFAEQYGPWALVAGASEGTGREFARAIAARGVPSILVARRAEPLAALAKEIRAESGVECV